MDSQDESTAAGLRQALVDELIQKGLIHSPAVEAAFRRVPRHLFVPHVSLTEAYADEAIANKVQDGVWVSSSSQPAIMAIMLEQLALQPGMKVLEIGAGTGYNAALLTHLTGAAGQVVSIDIDPQVCTGARQRLDAAGFPQVRVICADGGYGWSPAGPYDRIILTVGAPDLLPAWREQLKDGGRLVLPLKIVAGQQALALDRLGDLLTSRAASACGFMELRGAFAQPEAGERPLGPEPGLSVSFAGRPAVSPEHIYTFLQAETRDWETGLRVNAEELFGSLRLWLGLNDPEVVFLYAQGEQVRRQVIPRLYGVEGDQPWNTTAGLAGASGLALLAQPEGSRLPPSFHTLMQANLVFDLRVRQYGSDPELAQRLLRLVQSWDTAGRPASENLQVRVWPAGAQPAPAPGEILLQTRYAWLGLSWRG